jgi:hypothetical protein
LTRQQKPPRFRQVRLPPPLLSKTEGQVDKSPRQTGSGYASNVTTPRHTLVTLLLPRHRLATSLLSTIY